MLKMLKIITIILLLFSNLSYAKDSLLTTIYTGNLNNNILPRHI